VRFTGSTYNLQE
jgi:hypothetical protein